MRTETTPSRSTSLLAAATTVVALMAAAAGAERTVTVDGRLATAHEPAGARVMAVVLAAARDLLLPEHVPSTVPAPVGPDALVPSAAPPSAVADAAPHVAPQPPLGNRWPDLPPPTC